MSVKNLRRIISIPDGKKYVLIVLPEPMTRRMTIKHLLEAKRLGEELPRPHFLFDVRGASDIRGTLEKYEISEFSKSFGFRGDKVAVIMDPDDRNHDFADTVASNADYRHRLFTDEQDAISWLEGS